MTQRTPWNKDKCHSKETKAKMSAARKGSKNGFAKLTEEKVITLRKLKRAGRGYKDLAKEFNVHRSTCYYAITGVTWGHLP